MPKISLAGFRDPQRRVRYIIWSLVAATVLAGVVIVALGVTSTRWFCPRMPQGPRRHHCRLRTLHTRRDRCMACHMPVALAPSRSCYTRPKHSAKS
jgi:hypothetical protein